MSGSPPIPEAPSGDDELSANDLEPLRDYIDAIDRQLLLLMNERAQYANVIGYIKQQLRLPIYVPHREQDVIENVLGANEGPLSSEAVRRLFERLIDETRSLERQTYQEDPRPDFASG